MNTGMLITLVCFLFVAFCLLSGKIAGSIACGAAVVVLMLTGVITEQEALANFVGGSIVTMIGMMIVTAALMKTDILVNIAGMIKKFKGGTVILLAASMIIPFFLCQFVGGVTSMITVIPLAMALAEEADVPPTVVVLPASVGAQAGLMMLPIGGAAAMYLMKNQMKILCITNQADSIAVYFTKLLILLRNYNSFWIDTCTHPKCIKTSLRSYN